MISRYVVEVFPRSKYAKGSTPPHLFRLITIIFLRFSFRAKKFNYDTNNASESKSLRNKLLAARAGTLNGCPHFSSLARFPFFFHKWISGKTFCFLWSLSKFSKICLFPLTTLSVSGEIKHQQGPVN